MKANLDEVKAVEDVGGSGKKERKEGRKEGRKEERKKGKKEAKKEAKKGERSLPWLTDLTTTTIISSKLS